jgi:hypothetical protein
MHGIDGDLHRISNPTVFGHMGHIHRTVERTDGTYDGAGYAVDIHIGSRPLQQIFQFPQASANAIKGVGPILFATNLQSIAPFYRDDGKRRIPLGPPYSSVTGSMSLRQYTQFLDRRFCDPQRAELCREAHSSQKGRA